MKKRNHLLRAVSLIFVLLIMAGCAKNPPPLHTSKDQVIEITLTEVDSSTTAEVFGRIVRAADGVIEVKRYGQHVSPGNPQDSYTTYVATTMYKDPSRLDYSILENIRTLLSCGGYAMIRNNLFEFSPSAVESLMGVRLIDAGARQLEYKVDRELKRDREFAGEMDPYNPQSSICTVM